MNYILFDGPVRTALLPLTFTRPVADIRVGILTIREKWEKYLGTTTTSLTEDYLSEKFPMVEMEQNVMINASYLPTAELVELIQDLGPNQAVFHGENVVAFYTQESQETVDFDTYSIVEFAGECIQIAHPWDIFAKNDAALRADFALLTEDRTSQPIPKSVNVIAPEHIFIEEGAQLEFLNRPNLYRQGHRNHGRLCNSWAFCIVRSRRGETGNQNLWCDYSWAALSCGR